MPRFKSVTINEVYSGFSRPLQTGAEIVGLHGYRPESCSAVFFPAHLIIMPFSLWNLRDSEGFEILSDSYRTPGSLLPVILERMIGSRWNLLPKHRLLMTVLSMSNLPRPQQMALCARVTNLYTSTTRSFYMNHSVEGNKMNVSYPRLISPDDEGSTIFRNVGYYPSTHRHNQCL
jgi:hypothetical protein